MSSVGRWALGLVLVSVAASAQTSDAAYCKVLFDKYQAYVANMSVSVGRTLNPGTVDAELAMSQCKAGNTAAGIPVLEKKLRDARIDLPPRG
jgi:hypothetical protein